MNTRYAEPDCAQAGMLRSRMGAAYPGSHAIFRGHDLHRDLKNMDWVELYIFGITGRRHTTEQLRLLHAIWTYTSYPDARLWNNRVAALAGSSRSTGALGLSAALAISEATIYGRGIDMRAIDFLTRTRKEIDALNTSDENLRQEKLTELIRQELSTQRSIAGYGRPLVNGDERNPHILKLARELGLDSGPHLRLAFAIEQALLAGRWRMKMNYAALVAALGADIGLSPQEFYLFMFPTFLAGMPPGYIEAAERQEGTLYPTACTDILYEGPARRGWPNKLKRG